MERHRQRNVKSTGDMKAKIDGKFDALWRRMCRPPCHSEVTVPMPREWAEQMGVTVLSLDKKNVGIFSTTPALVLSPPEKQDCFPLSPLCEDEKWIKNREAANKK